jgi:hypothetical protein
LVESSAIVEKGVPCSLRVTEPVGVPPLLVTPMAKFTACPGCGVVGVGVNVVVVDARVGVGQAKVSTMPVTGGGTVSAGEVTADPHPAFWAVIS